MHAEMRAANVDTLRGLVAILVVFYHAIGPSPADGLQVEVASFWWGSLNLLAFFRMPLFAFVSGYIYARRPVTGDAKGFVFAKARRLLLPVLTVGTLAAVTQAIIPGTHHRVGDWATLHIMPFAQFWFLESLFVIFVTTVLLEWAKVLGSPAKIALTLIFTCAIQLVASYRVPILGIGGATYLLPYFILGVAVARFKLDAAPQWSIVLSGAALLCASGYVIAGIIDVAPATARVSLIALVLGLSACFLAVQFRWQNKVLAYIGHYSYAIFLFHVFFTAGTRISAYALNFYNLNALVLLTTFSGVTGPIIVEKIVSRWNVTNTLLLGAKWNGNATMTEPSVPRALDSRIGRSAIGTRGWFFDL